VGQVIYSFALILT